MFLQSMKLFLEYFLLMNNWLKHDMLFSMLYLQVLLEDLTENRQSLKLIKFYFFSSNPWNEVNNEHTFIVLSPSIWRRAFSKKLSFNNFSIFFLSSLEWNKLVILLLVQCVLIIYNWFLANYQMLNTKYLMMQFYLYEWYR